MFSPIILHTVVLAPALLFKSSFAPLALFVLLSSSPHKGTILLWSFASDLKSVHLEGDGFWMDMSCYRSGFGNFNGNEDN